MIWHYFKYLIMPIFTLIVSIASVINLVIVSYWNLGHISDENEHWIDGIEVFIGISFIIEFIYHFFMDYGVCYYINFKNKNFIIFKLIF